MCIDCPSHGIICMYEYAYGAFMHVFEFPASRQANRQVGKPLILSSLLEGEEEEEEEEEEVIH